MNRLNLDEEELLRETVRRETRSAKIGVGARKARSETRNAVRRIKGERVWYRWFMVEGIVERGMSRPATVKERTKVGGRREWK